MNILMTGHKGLIGTLLKKKLEEEGHIFVKCIDKRCGEDVLDIGEYFPKEKIDMVIHAASACKINKTIMDPLWSQKNNSEGTFKVIDFCRKNGIKKFVFFSSSRVLSKEKNPYTASKLYGEELCKGYKDCYGIDYLIIRPSTVYGPFWDLTKRLMHVFITNALRGEPLEIYGDPKTKTLDFTYVDDFVEGVFLAMRNEEWNKEYDISGGEESNVYELAKFIVEKTGSQSEIKVKGPEIAQPQKVKLNLNPIKSLGYSPKFSLEKGTLKCIDFYKKHKEEFGDLWEEN